MFNISLVNSWVNTISSCENFVVPYLDDIAIFLIRGKKSLLQHEAKNNLKAELTIKPSKCQLAQQNVKFLGHVGQGFRTSSDVQVQSVLEFRTLRTKTLVRASLGLTGYYSRYINLFSVIAAALTDALKGRN
ncbi:retrovirus-related Pol polyprotein from transposon 17.6 [Trichonephila clavipes]|nr:retrovirus-related Pol polyprotein from transposon 17.6 [Trichonephila clavipes]